MCLPWLTARCRLGHWHSSEPQPCLTTVSASSAQNKRSLRDVMLKMYTSRKLALNLCCSYWVHRSSRVAPVGLCARPELHHQLQQSQRLHRLHRLHRRQRLNAVLGEEASSALNGFYPSFSFYLPDPFQETVTRLINAFSCK